MTRPKDRSLWFRRDDSKIHYTRIYYDGEDWSFLGLADGIEMGHEHIPTDQLLGYLQGLGYIPKQQAIDVGWIETGFNPVRNHGFLDLDVA